MASGLTGDVALFVSPLLVQDSFIKKIKIGDETNGPSRGIE
jgi:hypothetical protein